MKIISWNINGYRSITGQNPSRRYDKITHENRLFEYIENEDPDIVCLQEIKANEEQINDDLLTPKGYNSFYNTSREKKGYSGVAVFTKQKPLKITKGFGIDKFDAEARVLELKFENFILLNIYFPKGYADNERLDYKLEFYDALFLRIKQLQKTSQNIVICGDYNTAHKEIDLARPKQNIGTSGFMPIEREKLDELIQLGFVDAFREINKEPHQYTWWSQRGRARENNVGWRIDYHFISSGLANKLEGAYLQPNIIGSDHCPAVVKFVI